MHIRVLSDVVIMIVLFTKTKNIGVIYTLYFGLTVKRNCFVTVAESKQTRVLHLNAFDEFKLRVTLYEKLKVFQLVCACEPQK